MRSNPDLLEAVSWPRMALVTFPLREGLYGCGQGRAAVVPLAMTASHLSARLGSVVITDGPA